MDGDVNVSQHVDFLIGMVPIVNLEWIQKFVRDTRDRGHSREAVMDSIVRSMDDYLTTLPHNFLALILTSNACLPSILQIRWMRRAFQAWMKASW
ncbi:phosphoribulokinase homolog [Vibrio ponticus]|nr:phosphoribulokinase homolog [Vibrio ponticus]